MKEKLLVEEMGCGKREGGKVHCGHLHVKTCAAILLYNWEVVVKKIICKLSFVPNVFCWK